MFSSEMILGRFASATAVAMAMAVAAAGCTAEEAAPAEEEGGTFNYVPLNINTCKAKDDNASRLKMGRALEQIGQMESIVAEQLQLCMDCPDNKLGFLLKDAVKPVMIGGKKVAGPFDSHVNKALAYPFRHLILSQGKVGGVPSLVIGQAIKVGSTKSTSYELQPETLAADCGKPDITTAVKVTPLQADCGDAIKTSFPASKAFGFKVPNALPPTTLSLTQASALLERTAGLGILVEKPEVQYTINDSGNGEGMLSGWVDPGQLKVFAASGVDLKKYVEGTPAKIRVVLQFKVKRIRTAVPAALRMAKLTAIKPSTAKKPPALTTATESWDGGGCTNCKVIGTENICAEELAKDVPLAAVHILGDSGSFKLKYTAAGTQPQIASSLLEGGGTIAADGDVALSEVQYTYTRGFRPGAGYQARPACVDVMTGKSPAPSTFDPKDGWIRVPFRGVNNGEMDCQRTMLICQQFDDTACGDNGKLNVDGTCGCADGFVSAFDACVKPADYGCAANAKLAKDAAGAVVCSCPSGFVGDGKTCNADPCKDNGVCKAGEHCSVGSDFLASCEAEGDSSLEGAALATRRTDVAAEFTAAVPPPGLDEKWGAASDDDEDDDDDGDAGDDDDAAAAPPPGAPGADFIADAGRNAKRSFNMASDLMFYPKKGTLKIAEDLDRKVGKKNFMASAIVAKMTSRTNGTALYQMYISAASAAKLQAAIKSKSLTTRMRLGLQTWTYDARQAEWYPSREQSPRLLTISKVYLAPCPDVVNLTNNKTELVHELTVTVKVPKLSKAQLLALSRAASKGMSKVAKR